MLRSTRLTFDPTSVLVTDDLQSISPRVPKQYGLRALPLALPFSNTWESEEAFERHPRFPDRLILKRHYFQG